MPEETPHPLPPQAVDVRVDPRMIDPMKSDPPWLKIVGAASSFGIICCLFVWLVMKVVNSQGEDIKTYEKVLERTDKILEAHDVRSRDWMKSVSDRNSLEHEKTRMELKSIADQIRLLKDTVGMMK